MKKDYNVLRYVEQGLPLALEQSLAKVAGKLFLEAKRNLKNFFLKNKTIPFLRLVVPNKILVYCINLAIAYIKNAMAIKSLVTASISFIFFSNFSDD